MNLIKRLKELLFPPLPKRIAALTRSLDRLEAEIKDLHVQSAHPHTSGAEAYRMRKLANLKKREVAEIRQKLIELKNKQQYNK